MTIRFKVPGHTKSMANERMHWAQKAKVVANERAKALRLCPKWEGGPLLVVALWRHGTRRLDDDNLRPALKAIRDGIASRLGVDDGSSLVRWEYGQSTCPSGQEHVEVAIEVVWQRHSGEMRMAFEQISPLEPVLDLAPPKKQSTPTPAVYKPRKP